MNPSDNQISSIPQFYNGKSVFITGGTGFLGKVLIEKLLRSCPGIENIYLLVRTHKDKNIEERHTALTASKAFDLLREKNPKSLKKIVLIYGDTSEVGLGISEEDRKILCDKVNVIFHSAATVRFVEQLKYSVNTNLRAVDEMLKLAKDVKHLKSFIHISTAYSNWYEPVVEEKHYKAEFDPHYVINLFNATPDDQLEKLAPRLYGKHVNIYTFTKSLAEDLAVQTPKNFAFAIVRPSVVGASYAEPFPGWVDSYTATTPLVDQSARGVLRVLNCHKDFVFDVIPVDIVINEAIAVSWKIANDHASKLGISSPLVYNCVSGNANPVTIKEICKYSCDAGKKSPSEMMRWYPQTRYYKTETLFKIDTYLTHYIPALLSDFVDKFRGENPTAVAYFNKVQYGASQLKFILNTSIMFQTENGQKLLKSMDKNDQKVFNFDPKIFNWKTYIDDFYYGIRKFKTNDKTACSFAAQKKFARLKNANFIVTGSIAAISLYALVKVGEQFINKDEKKSKVD
jgi:fatty acyl-CoA reductase